MHDPQQRPHQRQGVLDRLSIQSKLILMLLSTSACAILVVGYLGYSSGKAALTDASFNHLTGVRAAKAAQIRHYFAQVQRHIQALGEDRMVLDAAQEFRAAFQELRALPVLPSWDARLTAYYRDEFAVRLAPNVEGSPVFETYKPTEAASRYLQYHYIAANPHPSSERELLRHAEDGSRYSAVHQRYHPALRTLVSRLGYYDLFLIDAGTGEVLYTVEKEVDFATDLDRGPFQESNLARLVRQVREAPDRGSARLSDFKAYRPSYAEPAAFVATPLYEGSRLVAILALQLSTEEINDVMTGHRGWVRNGLGETGETYLVGSDLRMRSSSRFQLEDPQGYSRQLREQGVSERVVESISRFKTSILLQEVDTEAVREALRGQEGTRVIKDYRGIEVLSSFEPLRVEGLDWVVVAEMDVAEVNRPVHGFQRGLLVSSVVLVLLLTLLALYLTHVFVRPLRLLSTAARQVSDGNRDVRVDLVSQDEFGELAQTFNAMVLNLRKQDALAERQQQENETLLLNLLPGPVARRFKAGEGCLVETLQQATVLVASVSGLPVPSEQWPPEALAGLLGQLLDAFGEAAERHGVEWMASQGGEHVAACGVTVPRLDHTRRVAELALEMEALLQRVNLSSGTDLKLRAGIDSGTVMAGILSSRRLGYRLWGPALSAAQGLHAESGPGTLRVSRHAWERLQDTFAMEPCGEAWVLRAYPAATDVRASA